MRSVLRKCCGPLLSRARAAALQRFDDDYFLDFLPPFLAVFLAAVDFFVVFFFAGIVSLLRTQVTATR